MEIKIECLPPNVKVWMADDKIIMRYTLNVTSQVWNKLNDKIPKHCVKSNKRFLYGNAIYLKSLDKKTTLSAYRYLKLKTMAQVRAVKSDLLLTEVTKLSIEAVRCQAYDINSQKVIKFDAGLQE